MGTVVLSPQKHAPCACVRIECVLCVCIGYFRLCFLKLGLLLIGIATYSEDEEMRWVTSC